MTTLFQVQTLPFTAAAELQEDCCVLVTGAALRAICDDPDQLEPLPGRCYALQTEVNLAQQHGQPLTVPPQLVLINDARWVELTLNCQPLVNWG